jgi:hypothetical protein
VNRRRLRFNPVVQSAPAPPEVWTSEVSETCASCRRELTPPVLAGACLPGLFEGLLCLDCLYMASHELLQDHGRVPSAVVGFGRQGR